MRRPLAASILLLGLLLGPGGRAAHAQGAPDAAFGAAATPRTPDAPATLADRGVAAALAWSADALSTVGGDRAHGTSPPGLLDASVALDLGRLLDWERTSAFLRAIALHGRDPAATLGALGAPSNLAGPAETVRVLEAWLERRWLDDRVAVRGGLYAVDTEFDVRQTAAVFMNGGFGTGVELAQSGLNGPCVFPASCLGLRLRATPTPQTYLRLAVLNGVAGDPDDPHGTRVLVDPDRHGVFTIGEAGYERGTERGRFVRAAVGLWQHTGRFDDVRTDAAADESRRRRGHPGVYGLLEAELLRATPRTRARLDGFLRLGYADPDIHPVSHAFAAGLVGTGLLPGRDADVSALGVVVAANGTPFRHARRRAGAPVDDVEVVLELTHRLQPRPWLGVQAGLQYFVNPGTDPGRGDALLLGVRCTLTP